MTVEELKRSIQIFKEKGHTDSEILKSFKKMYDDGVVNLDALSAMCQVLGYELTEDFINEQKNK